MTSSAAARANIYGYRARIGYTSPPLTTEIFPYEFYKIVPAGVTLVLTTLAIVVRSKDEVDRSYDISMKAAREMAAAGVANSVISPLGVIRPILFCSDSVNHTLPSGPGVMPCERHGGPHSGR